jgi:hypothetical protein
MKQTNNELVAMIVERGFITENEIRLIKNRINRGAMKATDANPLSGLRLTGEQTRKGIDYLRDKARTPWGRMRRNNPFTDEELAIIDDFSHFTFAYFVDDAPRRPVKFLVPAYEVVSHTHGSFEYYMHELREVRVIS